MPHSNKRGKDVIQRIVHNLIDSPDFRILDIGCGEGTYGKLIQKPCVKIAVDAVDYRQKYDLLSVYDEFHLLDVRDIESLENLGKFDLAIAGDVLEHMNVNDAQAVLACLRRMAKHIIVAVPYMLKQDIKSMPYEKHLQPDLTPDVVMERYPCLELIVKYKFKEETGYGYYWCEGEEKDHGRKTTERD